MREMASGVVGPPKVGGSLCAILRILATLSPPWLEPKVAAWSQVAGSLSWCYPNLWPFPICLFPFARRKS
jgi:hypothetical protein